MLEIVSGRPGPGTSVWRILPRPVTVVYGANSDTACIVFIWLAYKGGSMDDREMLLVLTIVRLLKGRVVAPYRVEIVYQEEENKLRQWRPPQTKQQAFHH